MSDHSTCNSDYERSMYYATRRTEGLNPTPAPPMIEKPPIIQQIEKAKWYFGLCNGYEAATLFLGKAEYDEFVNACPAIEYQFNGKTYDGLDVRRTDVARELRVL